MSIPRHRPGYPTHVPQPLTLAEAVELAVVERSGFVESRHSGAALVLAPDGTVSQSLGSTDALVLPRSTLKPLQALACVAAGAPLEGESLCLASASHSGTDRHVAIVRDILSTAGLHDGHLKCPPSWPSDRATRHDLVQGREDPARIRHACSGKHAAMLATCVAAGWPTDDYLSPDHPVQEKIRETAERLVGEKAAATAVDGCGAPVWAMSMAGLAKATQRIGTSSPTSPFALHRLAGTLVARVRENPWTIAGPGHADTVLTERLGVFSKSGAEGMQVMVAPDGTTAVVKVIDGSSRAPALVALSLLERAGALSAPDVAEALTALRVQVWGGEQVVGTVRASIAP